MLVRLAVAVTLGALALAGCSDDGAGELDPSAGTYAVQSDDGWEVQEAVDPAAHDPRTGMERPPLDWYAEYVRPDHTEMVRLSAHDARIGETRAELERLGFAFAEVAVPGCCDGVAGTQPGDPAGPEVLLVPWGDRTLMALSYDVPREVLSGFVGTVEGATRGECTDAGGVIH